jgi:DNA polymerase-3 subunit beta
MKFSIQKSKLQKILQEVSKGVPTRSTLPVLSCGLFVVKNNMLNVRTTDLEISLSSQQDVLSSEDGSLAIPITKLNEICSAMPDEEIFFEASDIGKLKISNSVGNYTIMGQSPEEFPTKQEIGESRPLKVPSDQLLYLISNTIYAVSKDDLKPSLQGVLFKIDQAGATAVSTDGHRLVKIKLASISSEEETSIIIPAKFLNIIRTKLAEEKLLSLALGGEHILATFENFSISSRTIKEKYPDFESVIPKDNNLKLLVEKNDILDSVKRVSIFSNRATKQIAMKLEENKLTISTEDVENITTGKETVMCEYKGDNLTIGYNATYLKEVLTHCGEGELTVLLKSSLGAGIFLSNTEDENTEKTTLLMPIRLND